MSVPTHRFFEEWPSERLRVGEYLVDLPLREVSRRDGEAEPVRITLKSLGVLLTLVAHRGKAVTRETLLEWVWPGTLPTDDVVTQAIVQLRKALNGDRDNTRYIETIAKQGYRLIAPVEWLMSPERVMAAHEAVQAPPPGGARANAGRSRFRLGPAHYRNIVAPLVVVAGFFLLGRGILDMRPRAQDLDASAWPANPAAGAAAASIQRIATLPQFEGQPSLSSDGTMVVYSRESEDGAALMLQTSAAVPPRQVTEPVAGQRDMMPAWSPDGHEIAFIRRAAESCTVMSIPATGGAAREIGACIDGRPHPLSWYADGKALVASASPGSDPRTRKGLQRMALETGRWQPIAYDRAPTDEDLTPRVSPDGRWIAFQRNLSLGDVWRIKAEGGKAERLTQLRTNIYGLSWSADSRHLVFARYYELGGSQILSSLELDTGRLSDYTGGRGGLTYPSVARSGDMVAFEVEDGRSRMRRLRFDDTEAEQAAQTPFFESSGSNLLPSIAPDGDQVLFVSNRSGEPRLWWAESGRPDTLRAFEGFLPLPRYPVVWHLSSQRALAIGRGAAGRGLYEIEPRQGRALRLPLPDGGDPVHAAYHPDPMLLLVVADSGAGRLRLTLYDRSREPWRALARIDDVAFAFADRRHQRVVFARTSGPELWATGLDLGAPHITDRLPAQWRTRLMASSGDEVWVMGSREGCRWYWRPVAEADSGEMPQGRCLGSRSLQPEGLSYDAEGRTLYWSMADEANVDIGVLPLAALGVPKQARAQSQ